MKVIEGKVVVLGAQGVGKTSMVVRYMGKLFSKHISPTIGASFFTCRINLGNTTVKLQLWDTAGQERFKSMAPMYYRNANVAILVYDITNRNSFNELKLWVKELKSNITESIVLCLVGNKLDLDTHRMVNYDDVASYAMSINAYYCETSALQDQGIEQLFIYIASSLVKLSGDTTLKSIRIYDDSIESGLVTATQTELSATHTGNVEVPAWSIDSIAHGEEKIYGCCY